MYVSKRLFSDFTSTNLNEISRLVIYCRREEISHVLSNATSTTTLTSFIRCPRGFRLFEFPKSFGLYRCPDPDQKNSLDRPASQWPERILRQSSVYCTWEWPRCRVLHTRCWPRTDNIDAPLQEMIELRESDFSTKYNGVHSYRFYFHNEMYSIAYRVSWLLQVAGWHIIFIM